MAARIVLSVLLGAGTILSGVCLLAISAFVVAKAALLPPIAELQLAIVGLRFTGIARGVLRYLERYTSHGITLHILGRLRVWFYDLLAPLAPARLLTRHSGDLMARILADIATLEDFYARVLTPPAVALLTVVGGTLVLAGLDLRLALSTLGFFVLAALGLPLLSERLTREPGARLVQLRSQLYVASLDAVGGMADLLAFGHAPLQARLVEKLTAEGARHKERWARVDALGEAMCSLLAQFSIAAALLILIPIVRSGALDGILLAVIPLGLLAGFEAFGPLTSAFRRLHASREAARRLEEVVAAPPAVSEPPEPKPLPRNAGLVIDDLSFRYEAGRPLALDGITLELPEGSSTAIVGPSGSGKTTLVHLLNRFWDYSQGRILIGGVEIRDCTPETIRRWFSVLPQDPYLFTGTIRQNLLLANPQASEGALLQSLRVAQAQAFVAELPEGLDTFVGEGGVQLSGGQRQRIALARSLLKDSPILILDEPTNHVDPILARALMHSLRACTTDRSWLVITHRLLDLECMDQIVILRAGRIVGRGTHRSLMASGGYYRPLWEAQVEHLKIEAAHEVIRE